MAFFSLILVDVKHYAFERLEYSYQCQALTDNLDATIVYLSMFNESSLAIESIHLKHCSISWTVVFGPRKTMINSSQRSLHHEIIATESFSVKKMLLNEKECPGNKDRDSVNYFQKSVPINPFHHKFSTESPFTLSDQNSIHMLSQKHSYTFPLWYGNHATFRTDIEKNQNKNKVFDFTDNPVLKGWSQTDFTSNCSGENCMKSEDHHVGNNYQNVNRHNDYVAFVDWNETVFSGESHPQDEDDMSDLVDSELTMSFGSYQTDFTDELSSEHDSNMLLEEDEYTCICGGDDKDDSDDDNDSWIIFTNDPVMNDDFLLTSSMESDASFYVSFDSESDQISVDVESTDFVCCINSPHEDNKNDIRDKKCHSERQRKQVHFAPAESIVEVHHMFAWSYAYRTSRKGEWEKFACDRAHFQRRIERTAEILNPVIIKKLNEIRNSIP